MLEFRNWLEMSQLADADTSHIKLEPYGMSSDGYIYNFEHSGQKFAVTMWPKAVWQGNVELPLWEVEFRGGGGYELTGKAGGAATAIYSQLILAMKKLMETHDVKGFYFSPAEPAMALIYDKFYRQFLKKKFLRVNKNMYLDKEFIRTNLKDFKQEEKPFYYKSIINANREQIAYRKKARDNKAEERRLRMMMPRLIHTIVRYARYYGDGSRSSSKDLAYIISADGFNMTVLRKSGQQLYFVFDNDARGIVLDEPPTDAEIIEFLKLTLTSHAVRPDEFKSLMPYYQKYGILAQHQPAATPPDEFAAQFH